MRILKSFSALVGLYMMTVSSLVAVEKINPIYEKKRPGGSEKVIDRLVLEELKKNNIEPAAFSSDAVFLRRIYQDLTGSVPEIQASKRFIKDNSPAKRAKLIDFLLKTERYNEYWTLKYCDLLRVKSEFPINLWPNATQAYHRWIYNAVKSNMPYDKFARKLLLSSGSNFRNPEVNFYRALADKNPEGFARAAMLTFMGTRYDKWPEAERKNIVKFFSRIKYKSTNEWKEQIVYNDFTTGKTILTRLADGTKQEIAADKDPREVFTKWLVSADNSWFASCAVNRVWYWLMGRGIIHEADDIMPESKSANPALLKYLEKEFVKSGFNLQHIIRLIVNSDTYQQSFIPRSKSPQAEALFAHYIVRRLDAEVIIDMIESLGFKSQKYVSPIPEPFTYVPVQNRTISLSDGSIGSQFLSCFGRPPRDSGILSERKNISSSPQRLFILNSNYIQRQLTRSRALKAISRRRKVSNQHVVSEVYLLIFNRYPAKSESTSIIKYAKKNKTGRYWTVMDLAWALVNSKEFLYHH